MFSAVMTLYIVHTGGFDHNEVRIPVDPGTITLGVGDEASFRQFQICLKNLFLQLLQHNSIFT